MEVAEVVPAVPGKSLKVVAVVADVSGGDGMSVELVAVIPDVSGGS